MNSSSRRTVHSQVDDRADSACSADLSTALSEIDNCLRQWKIARGAGETTLSEWSNALLLRTYVDKGKGANRAAVWGALAGAGRVVPCISMKVENQVRRLHTDLVALQEVMLKAAKDIQRWASYLQSFQHATDQRVRSGSNGETTLLDTVQEMVGGGYSVADVGDASADVGDMLMQEALVTATITKGVADCQDRETLIMYVAAWTMQPYLDVGRMVELQTMVGKERSPRQSA